MYQLRISYSPQYGLDANQNVEINLEILQFVFSVVHVIKAIINWAYILCIILYSPHLYYTISFKMNLNLAMKFISLNYQHGEKVFFFNTCYNLITLILKLNSFTLFHLIYDFFALSQSLQLWIYIQQYLLLLDNTKIRKYIKQTKSQKETIICV